MARANVESNRSAHWRGAAQVIALVRREPGITRAAAAQRLTMSSGSMTEVAARLREVRLLAEAPAPAGGRGRPTTVLRSHPAGPLALAAEIRQEDWRCCIAALDGKTHLLESGRHGSRSPDSVLAALRRAIGRARQRYGERIGVVSLAVSGTVRADRLVQAATLGWGSVDLTTLTDASGPKLLVGNDATLGGVAESRNGAAAGAGTALHVLVEVGVGGSLVVDGQPIVGATGAGGEYGHLPFGDGGRLCPCGARGCWDLEVDGRALARHLGEAPPADPRTYTREILDRASADPHAQRALGAVGTALGAGIAGLVNSHDPEIVTIGGLAISLRAAAPAEFGAAYVDGLMAFQRATPPRVVDATHGDDGALNGAVAVGLDHITSEAALAAWADRTPS